MHNEYNEITIYCAGIVKLELRIKLMLFQRNIFTAALFLQCHWSLVGCDIFQSIYHSLSLSASSFCDASEREERLLQRC